MKKTFTLLRGENSKDVYAACRLAEQGHVGRVAAECFNIILHPLESGQTVKNTKVTRLVLQRAVVVERRM